MILEDDDDPEFDDDDDDDLTVSCPHCGEPVFEDAEQCPSCGNYLSKEDKPWSRPVWLVVGVVICLAITLFWYIP